MTQPGDTLKFAAPHGRLLDSISRIETGSPAKTANIVSREVHRHIGYLGLSATARNFDFTPEAIAETGKTNCFGLSIITSEILSSMGIKNSIIFANMHSLVFADDAMILDPSTPQLNKSSTDNIISIVDPRYELAEKESGSGRMAAWLSPNELMRGIGKGSITRDMLEWLSFTKNTRDYRGYREDTLKRNDLLMTSLTPDAMGRKALESMANYQIAVMRGLDDRASEILLGMKGMWPEIDNRNLGNEKLFLNKHLLRQGKKGVSNFAEQVDAVSSSVTELSGSVRAALWKPDLFRKVASQNKNIDMMHLAVKCYRDIYEQARQDGKPLKIVLTKLRRAELAVDALAKVA